MNDAFTVFHPCEFGDCARGGFRIIYRLGREWRIGGVLCKKHLADVQARSPWLDAKYAVAHAVPTNSSPLGTRGEQSEGSDDAD